MIKTTVIALAAAASMIGVATPTFAEDANLLPTIAKRAEPAPDALAVASRQSVGARVLFDDASAYYRETLNDSSDGTGKVL